MRIGVAVSGGGHRAAAWAFGAFAALIANGANKEVVSIASVSGGSIANAVVAAAGDFRAVDDSRTFVANISRALRVAAVDGLFFPGPRTRSYIATTFGLIGATALTALAFLSAVIAVGREPLPLAHVLGGALLGAVVGLKLAAVARRRRSAMLLLAVALSALAAWVGAMAVQALEGPWAWVTVIVLAAVSVALAWLSIVLLSQRGAAVTKALEQDLLASPDGRPLALADLASDVNHVICATDLESGDHFYLSPRFLYGYREGMTTDAPRRITAAAAVQASAALPAAFPPSIIETGPFIRDDSIRIPPQSPHRVVLSDGGVYDNMAEQWETNLSARLRDAPVLAQMQQPADLLVVANASAMWDWRPFGATSRIGRELLGLQRDQGVQYDVSTARRRQHLLHRFRAALASGSGLRGVIVMIDREPARLAEPFTAGSDDIARRAAEAMEFIHALRTADEWRAITKRNGRVATTLGPIGKEATLDLMEHAYTSTMVGLYVLHGIGILKAFPRQVYTEAIDGASA